MNNNFLYHVVIENEDDPYCSHWDDTIGMTYSKEHAIEKCKQYINIINNTNNCNNYTPRIYILKYNNIKNEYESILELSTYMNVLKVVNLDKIFPHKDTDVEMYVELEIDDVFLGKLHKQIKCKCKDICTCITAFNGDKDLIANQFCINNLWRYYNSEMSKIVKDIELQYKNVIC
jgi:hypothetical protein